MSNAKAKQIAFEKLKTSHKWIAAEQRRVQLLKQRERQLKQLLKLLVDAIKRSTTSAMILLLFALVVAGWGWVAGINTPPLIACPNQLSFCYQARLRTPKLATPEPTKIWCTDTKEGLACLFPHQAQPSKKPQPIKKPKIT